MATPKRDVLKAAEVCEVAGVQPYVLRSWEAEFPQLGQALTGGGPRLYRRSDVEMILRIKDLVVGEGLTLAGVRRRLAETEAEQAPEQLDDEAVWDEGVRERVRQVRDGLRGILQMLAADPPPTLVLAPDAPERRGKTRRRAADDRASAS